MQELMGYIDSAWYDGHPPFTRYELETLIESFYPAEKRQITDAFKAGEINIAGILMEDFNRLHGTSHKVPTNDGDDAEKYFKAKYNENAKDCNAGVD